jgi:hypothetical protein
VHERGILYNRKYRNDGVAYTQTQASVASDQHHLGNNFCSTNSDLMVPNTVDRNPKNQSEIGDKIKVLDSTE